MNHSGKRIVKIIKKIKKLHGSDYFDAIDRLEITLARIMILENKEKLLNLFHSLYVDCVPLEDISSKLLVVFDPHKDMWTENFYTFFGGYLLGQIVDRWEDAPRHIEIDESIHRDVLLNELNTFCKVIYNKSAKSNLKLFTC